MDPQGRSSSELLEHRVSTLDILEGWHQIRGSLDGTSELEKRLWLLALLFLGIDILTTAYGLHLGFGESNPVARFLLSQYGPLAFGLLKGFTLVVAGLGWAVMPNRYRFIVPGCIAGPWAVGSFVNAAVILSVIG